MLYYALLFCGLGAAIGFLTPVKKVAIMIIIGISVFWMLGHGVWGVFTLIELTAGYALGRFLKSEAGGDKENP